ncbi:uncharacterized protein PAN0_006d3004 [Moesziomyces antarcticus]|uniref:Uncharacterized protein n=2 Tax=Pseudozyma antarctica TaxID=84753 RepID=A0A081CDP3_PSEA2|nr:uncharacterized protein PAN0_006d3004 [Moesziomyces antarcticus]GAK64789.1 conserved hypothetical protein [Moesziomyces antarcticus]
MSQSTPTAVTKRKVMGRMDSAPAESPSGSVTPNARPRIVRAQHGYSSPSLSNTTTPTASRPTAGTGRARVDMSAFASPAQSSPAMSPSTSRPMSASSAASANITARLSAPSPSVRSHTPLHAKSSSSTVGVAASSYKLHEARIDPPVDPNLASLRSPRIRTRNGSVDLSASPSITSPSSRPPPASQSMASIPRAEQSQFHKPFAATASPRPAPALPTRQLLSPQRQQAPADQAALRATIRSPSPTQTAASTPSIGRASCLQNTTQPPTQYPSGRQTPSIASAQASAGGGTAPGRLASDFASSTPADDLPAPPLSAGERWPDGASGGYFRPDQTPAASNWRASLRSGSTSQRAAIPSAFADLADGLRSPRRSEDARSSFASSSHSALMASLPLSPTSDTPRSPSEAGEAEEARIHRKLLDLEITNKSLLAINSALEVTKLKQAKEIRELKRRLREGRSLSFGAVSRDSVGSGVFSDDDALESESDDDASDFVMAREDPELEAAHQRCKDLVDGMVEQARRAILAEYEAPENTGGKVLHPAEIEEMQRVAEEGDETGADTTFATDLLETSITFDHSSGDTSREDLPASSSLQLPNGVHLPTDAASSTLSDDAVDDVLKQSGPYASGGDVSID